MESIYATGRPERGSALPLCFGFCILSAVHLRCTSPMQALISIFLQVWSVQLRSVCRIGPFAVVPNEPALGNELLSLVVPKRDAPGSSLQQLAATDGLRTAAGMNCWHERQAPSPPALSGILNFRVHRESFVEWLDPNYRFGRPGLLCDRRQKWHGSAPLVSRVPSLVWGNTVKLTCPATVV